MKKVIKRILIGMAFAVFAAAVFLFGINALVVMKSSKHIISEQEAVALENVDCILVLGAGVWASGPSPMLADRLDESILLYKAGDCKKLLMSGDHGSDDYNEVGVMKDYAIDAGVPSEDIFMDHAGFSTYDSIYRAKGIFGADKIIIVTQKYHMFRALYIAEKLGVEAYGVTSDPRSYVGAEYREAREVLARDKDFFQCILKLKPKYLGEMISLDGSGDITNER